MYGYSRVTLGAVFSALGVYFKFGFQTVSPQFNTIFNEFNTLIRTVGPDSSSQQNTYSEINGLIDDIEQRVDDSGKNISRIPPLLYTEKNNNQLYRESIAANILKLAIKSDRVVSVLVGMNLEGERDIKLLFSDFIWKMSSVLGSVYVPDKEGFAEIFMFKDI